MEKFEDWFHNEGLEMCIDLALSRGTHAEKNIELCNSIILFLKLAWKHQQAKIDKLEQENQILSVHVKWFDQVLSGGSHRLVGKIKELEQEKRELIEALGMYGDKDNWSKPYLRQGKTGRQVKNNLHEDGGKRARQALSKIKAR